MKTLRIEWQHIEKDGKTCKRCGDTGQTLVQVMNELTEELKPQGIRVRLQETKLSPLRRLRKYFESLNEAALKAGFAAGCLLGNFAAELSAQSPLVREQVAEAFARWCDAIAVVIGQAQKEGAISRTLPPKALAEFVVHAWEGAMVRAKEP